MSAYSLPHLHMTGTNYEIGRSIVKKVYIKKIMHAMYRNFRNKLKGKEFKDRIQKYLNDFDFFKSKILPFIQTDDGKRVTI